MRSVLRRDAICDLLPAVRVHDKYRGLPSAAVRTKLLRPLEMQEGQVLGQQLEAGRPRKKQQKNSNIAREMEQPAPKVEPVSRAAR